MKTRFTCIILAVLLLLAGAAVPAGTSSPVTVTAPELEILAGRSTLTFSVTISALPQRGLISCRFNTRIDGARFISAVPNAALGGFISIGPLEGSEKNGVGFFWMNYDKPITSDTIAVTYTVELPESAGGDDELAIVITPSADRNDFVDRDENAVGVSAVSGLIRILCDHALEYQPNIPASCESDGQLAHRKCRICLKRFTPTGQAVPLRKEDILIPACGHIWQDWEMLVEPSCSAPGIQIHVCKNDSAHTEMRSVPQSAHNLTLVPAVTPTLSSEGNIEHWKCAGCNRLFADADASAELESQSIILSRIRPGDVNGDTRVNVKDVILIMRAMIGQIPAPYFPDAADINADGCVDAKDIIEIMKTIVNSK